MHFDKKRAYVVFEIADAVAGTLPDIEETFTKIQCNLELTHNTRNVSLIFRNL